MSSDDYRELREQALRGLAEAMASSEVFDEEPTSWPGVILALGQGRKTLWPGSPRATGVLVLAAEEEREEEDGVITGGLKTVCPIYLFPWLEEQPGDVWLEPEDSSLGMPALRTGRVLVRLSQVKEVHVYVSDYVVVVRPEAMERLLEAWRSMNEGSE